MYSTWQRTSGIHIGYPFKSSSMIVLISYHIKNRLRFEFGTESCVLYTTVSSLFNAWIYQETEHLMVRTLCSLLFQCLPLFLWCFGIQLYLSFHELSSHSTSRQHCIKLLALNDIILYTCAVMHAS